jgi:hypothetical protein
MERDVVSEDSEKKRRMLVEAGYDFRPTEDLWVNELYWTGSSTAASRRV